MKIRIISAVVLTAILIAALAGGGITMFILSAVTTAIGMFELYKVVDTHKKAIGIVGYLLAATYYAMLWFDLMKYLNVFCVLAVILIMATYVASFSKVNAKQAAMTFLGVFYVALPLSYLYQVRIMENGLFIFILLFISSWIADTCAYFVGSAIGKHKLVPVLSPKKSIEGAIGGVLGSTIIGAIYGLVLGNIINKFLVVAFAIICAAGAVISIFGDLAASAIKRNYDIKDYGKLIPGHGGILDRFDSMIFVAPIVFYVANLTIK